VAVEVSDNNNEYKNKSHGRQFGHGFSFSYVYDAVGTELQKDGVGRRFCDRMERQKNVRCTFLANRPVACGEHHGIFENFIKFT
jgi:hypothetical protein